jgi:hypothetical protein
VNAWRRRIVVYLLVLLPYFGVGVLSVRVAGEPTRTREQLQVDCPFYGLIAAAPLPSNASELGKRLIRASTDSYNKPARDCPAVLGPLKTPSPAPSPASSPSPS